jgi:hypothetical protein
MDGRATQPIPAFRSPPRILIPTLVRSRDQWKEKAFLRKRKLKLANLKIRDLTRSRQAWKLRHQQLEVERDQLQTERDQLQTEREHAHVLADAKKK